MEHFNARFVAERELGVVVREWKDAPGAVVALARDPARQAHLRNNLHALPANRAVYESLEIIARAANAGSRNGPARAG
jgi:UDP-N-acetylglucosamine:LPS N-acetylglucosamine transferase